MMFGMIKSFEEQDIRNSNEPHVYPAITVISLNRVVLPWQKFWGQVNDHERNPRGVFNLDHENDISLGFCFRRSVDEVNIHT